MGFLDTDQEICPICAKKSAVTIMLDRVLILCECDTCQKFIVKEDTSKNLQSRKDFVKNRQKLSDYVREYYNANKRPLEIVLDEDTPVTKNYISLSEILKDL